MSETWRMVAGSPPVWHRYSDRDVAEAYCGARAHPAEIERPAWDPPPAVLRCPECAVRVAPGPVLAVDPGARYAACALFGADRFLRRAAKIEPLGGRGPRVAETVAAEVAAWAGVEELAATCAHGSRTPLGLWVEVPQDYAARTATHHDLGRLRTTLGEIERRLRRDLAVDVTRKRPSTWKGQVPKGVHHARVRELLTPGERRLLGPAPGHDVLDAVALGLFALGRAGRGGAQP